HPGLGIWESIALRQHPIECRIGEAGAAVRRSFFEPVEDAARVHIVGPTSPLSHALILEPADNVIPYVELAQSRLRFHFEVGAPLLVQHFGNRSAMRDAGKQ